MRILIIGGTGNISTAITRIIQGRGDDITLFNNDIRRPDWLLPEVRVITGNRKDLLLYKDQLLMSGDYDCVIDMICFEPEDAAKDIQLFAGTTRQFIFCSTVDVYPKRPFTYPVTEEVEIEALPSFGYAFNKVACEKLLWEAHNQDAFGLTVIRPAATYNESWSPGIHTFGGQTYHLDRIRKGKPIILHGDGTSIWVSLHRDDTAGAFAGAIGNKKSFGNAYNVTGDELMTHNMIWSTIARVMNAPEPDFVWIPSILLSKLLPVEAEWCRENFMHNNIYDNSKAKKDLGFRYNIKFEEGVKRCIAYLDQNNLIEDSDKYPFYDKLVAEWRKMEIEVSARLNTVLK